mmetsp:Transcript_5571/g.15972  ORF Transcript_5571/g.15972 Transcript_5571/m.15972 type:complete len:239 (+) Transcript_5571:110-826(+)
MNNTKTDSCTDQASAEHVTSALRKFASVCLIDGATRCLPTHQVGISDRVRESGTATRPASPDPNLAPAKRPTPRPSTALPLALRATFAWTCTLEAKKTATRAQVLHQASANSCNSRGRPTDLATGTKDLLQARHQKCQGLPSTNRRHPAQKSNVCGPRCHQPSRSASPRCHLRPLRHILGLRSLSSAKQRPQKTENSQCRRLPQSVAQAQRTFHRRNTPHPKLVRGHWPPVPTLRSGV